MIEAPAAPRDHWPAIQIALQFVVQCRGSLISMRWVAIFQDEPAMLAIRQEHSAQHFDYLRRHEQEILIAGGLREAPGSDFVGGLWVLEVATRERAVALIEGDPYFIPAYRSYRLFAWGKAFADKSVVL